MTEHTLALLDKATGALLLDDELPTATEAAHDLASLLGTSTAIGCANPRILVDLSDADPDPASARHKVRISGVWHNSLIEGPGRRSVVRFQGCPIRCAGCYVPETHDFNGGYDANVDVIGAALLDPAYERDGVTILGGEPFAQPAALLSLIGELRGLQPDLHIVVYTGYMLESLGDGRALRFFAGEHTAADIAGVLASIDVLIDSPYFKFMTHDRPDCQCEDETRRFTGSCNQRIHRLR